jgi:hypothetical protein
MTDRFVEVDVARQYDDIDHQRRRRPGAGIVQAVLDGEWLDCSGVHPRIPHQRRRRVHRPIAKT